VFLICFYPRKQYLFFFKAKGSILNSCRLTSETRYRYQAVSIFLFLINRMTNLKCLIDVFFVITQWLHCTQKDGALESYVICWKMWISNHACSCKACGRWIFRSKTFFYAGQINNHFWTSCTVLLMLYIRLLVWKDSLL
jgi:hypothetical protein